MDFSLVFTIIEKFQKAIPFINKLNKKKDVGYKPTKNLESNPLEKILDDALSQLGAGSINESIWSKAFNQFQASYTRPEQFNKTYIQEWLSDDSVKKSLKKIALACQKRPKLHEETSVAYFMRIGGEEWELLLNLYESNSLEKVSATSENDVTTAIAYLVVSISASLENPLGTTLILERLSSDNEVINNTLNDLKDNQINISYSQSSFLTKHIEDDLTELLEQIVSEGLVLGRAILPKLKNLIIRIEKQEFGMASLAKKIHVYDLMARYSAIYKEEGAVEEALKKIEELGGHPSVITNAWCLFFENKVDEATSLLDTEVSKDARSAKFRMLFSSDKGRASDYLDQQNLQDVNTFNDVEWVNVIAHFLDQRNFDVAKEVVLMLPLTMKENVPYLFYQQGFIYSLLMFPPEVRNEAVDGNLVYGTEYLLAGDDIDLLRKEALISFRECINHSKLKGYKDLFEQAEFSLRWVQITDQASRESEIIQLKEDLSKEVDIAINLLPLAYVFKIEFDITVLKNKLLHEEELGWTHDKYLSAKLMLLRHMHDFQGIVTFVKANEDRLKKILSDKEVNKTHLDSLLNLGQWDSAAELLEKYGATLTEQDQNMYQVWIQALEGKDPEKNLRTLVEKTGGILELENLISSLMRKKNWQEAKKYTFMLFERVRNIANAKQYVTCMIEDDASHKEITTFLEAHLDISKSDDSLLSTYAWSLYHCGELNEAKLINDTLLAKRSNEDDLVLDSKLALRSGDWDRIPAILDKIWEKRHEIGVKLLLYFAQLNMSRNAERTKQLLEEVAIKCSDDPHILLAVSDTLIKLGYDELGIPLIQKAKELSDPENGPVKSYLFAELVGFLKKNSNDEQNTLERYHRGEAPLHIFSKVANLPLSHYYILLPLINTVLVDARKKQFIHIRSSGTPLLDITQKLEIKAIAFDLTSVMILEKLNIFTLLIDLIDCTYLSARFMEQLWEEEEQIKYHQPSIIEEAKVLIRYQKDCLFDEKNILPPSNLVNEVGMEVAILLEAAKKNEGIFVYSSTLYKVGSYMDKEANIIGYENYLVDPIEVVKSLHHQGQITTIQKNNATTKLGSVCQNKNGHANKLIANESPLYLDLLTAKYLEDAGILSRLVQSRKVFISSQAFSEWQLYIDREKNAQDVINVLSNIRNIVKKGLKDGKIQFLKETNSKKEGGNFGAHVLPLIDIATSSSEQIDAFCIDDRYVSQQFAHSYLENRNQYFLCSVDMINYLCSKEIIASDIKDNLLYQLRVSGFVAVPFTLEEVEKYLLSADLTIEGELIESAELKQVREYVCSLQASEFMQTNDDLKYWASLNDISIRLIEKLWADESIDLKVVEAKSSWVVDYILPDLETILRFNHDYLKIISNEYTHWLFRLMYVPSVDNERFSACKDWLSSKFFLNALPGCSEEINKLVEQLGSKLLDNIGSVANEYRYRSNNSKMLYK